ncbi:hypothetical protein [Schumannella luteola]
MLTLAIVAIVVVGVVLVVRYLDARRSGDADAVRHARNRLIVLVGAAVMVAIGESVLHPGWFG